MGALAIGATVGGIATILDGMTVCHLHFCKKKQTCRECCSDISKDIKEGELSLDVIILCTSATGTTLIPLV